MDLYQLVKPLIYKLQPEPLNQSDQAGLFQFFAENAVFDL